MGGVGSGEWDVEGPGVEWKGWGRGENSQLHIPLTNRLFSRPAQEKSIYDPSPKFIVCVE